MYSDTLPPGGTGASTSSLTSMSELSPILTNALLAWLEWRDTIPYRRISGMLSIWVIRNNQIFSGTEPAILSHGYDFTAFSIAEKSSPLGMTKMHDPALRFAHSSSHILFSPAKTIELSITHQSKTYNASYLFLIS